MDKLINYEDLGIFRQAMINDKVISEMSTWSSSKISNISNSRYVELAQYVIPDALWYTSTDGTVIAPTVSSSLPQILSNTVEGGLGTIKFVEPLTHIDNGAFRGPTNPKDSKLSSITIPNSVTSIGYNAFGGNGNLRTVKLSNNLTSIEGLAFSHTDIESIIIPSGVTSFSGEGTFQNCGRLSTVYLPSGLTDTGQGTFSNCGALRTINFPNGLITIGDNSFYGTSLTNIIIPDTVTTIKAAAFKNCSNLTSVQLSNSLTTMQNSAFEGTNLTSITIPDSLTSIGDDAFAYCRGLTSATIGNGVTSIGRQAFYHCGHLGSVIIGNSVTNIGYEAFCHCSSLSSITIPNSVTNIGERAFQSGGLTSVTIPNSVISIGNLAFDSVAEVTMESSTPITLEDGNGEPIKAFGEVGGVEPGSGAGSGSGDGSDSGSGSGGRTIRIYVPAAAFNDYYNSQDAGWQYYHGCLVNPND